MVAISLFIGWCDLRGEVVRFFLGGVPSLFYNLGNMIAKCVSERLFRLKYRGRDLKINTVCKVICMDAVPCKLWQIVQ